MKYQAQSTVYIHFFFIYEITYYFIGMKKRVNLKVFFELKIIIHDNALCENDFFSIRDLSIKLKDTLLQILSKEFLKHLCFMLMI